MKFKKYLGQHFLKNKSVAEKIMETANITGNDTVLEVGPGCGVLTELLIQKAGCVIAVEKDKDLVDFLMDKFSANGGSALGGKGQKNLSVIHADILKFNPDALWGRGSDLRRAPRSERRRIYKIVANIPYYITSRFLRKFLEADYQPSLMVLMLQKEVAERIVARDGKESLLSISVKVYGKPRIIAKVPAGNFFPIPKVDSAVIAIRNISKDFFNPPAGGNRIDEKQFFRMLKLGFGHKRKLLKSNLLPLSNTECLTGGFQECKIPALARPEELSPEDWKCLYNGFK